MNPLNPLMKLLKAIVYIMVLPFMVIGMVFQGVWMLLTGLLSVTAYILAFGCIVAVFGMLIGAPYLFLARSHKHVAHVEHVDSAYHVQHDQFGTEIVRQSYREPGHGARTEVFYYGPRGQRLRILRKQDVSVSAEVDENDVDFGELGTDLAAAGVASPVSAATETRIIVEPQVSQLDTSQSACDDESRERPDWVDAIFSSEEALSKVRVEAGPCVSKAACDVAYRDAQDQAIADFVRERSDVCLADLGITTMPWHELTVQRIAENLRLRPSDEFADTHDLALAGEAQRTYFKYGLLEFSPDVRDHIDREITRWARSFLAGGLWGMLLAGIGGVYLLLQFNVGRTLASMFATRRRTATFAVAMVMGVALAALTAIL